MRPYDIFDIFVRIRKGAYMDAVAYHNAGWSSMHWKVRAATHPVYQLLEYNALVAIASLVWDEHVEE